MTDDENAPAPPVRSALAALAYSGIAGGKTTGLSLGGAKALTGSGSKRWSTGELSIWSWQRVHACTGFKQAGHPACRAARRSRPCVHGIQLTCGAASRFLIIAARCARPPAR